ncbi:hypothetical protein [Stigmatella aurantiaca]|nr:hypothetical protein [Stigmatella aurantiaca]
MSLTADTGVAVVPSFGAWRQTHGAMASSHSRDARSPWSSVRAGIMGKE